MASSYYKDRQRQFQQIGESGARASQDMSRINQYNQERAGQSAAGRIFGGVFKGAVAQQYNQNDPAYQEAQRKKAEADKYAKSAEGRGMQLASTVIGPDGLERLGDDAEVQEVLRRKKQVADEGISLAEREAMRTKMSQQSAQAAQAMGMKMGGQLGGAKGAGVAAQMRTVQQANLQAQMGVERDIFLQNEQVKRSGLEAYATSLGEVKTFDIGQAAKERDIIQSSIMGYEQMDSAERSARIAAEAEVKAAKAAACHVAGTQVLMADESYKNIEDIKVGDEIAMGGFVYGTGVVMHQGSLYKYNNELVTGSHLIYDNNLDTYIRADKIKGAEEIYEEEFTLVFPLYTENKCYFTTFLSGDFSREDEHCDRYKDYNIK